jgi:hypothetical protein
MLRDVCIREWLVSLMPGASIVVGKRVVKTLQKPSANAEGT